MKKLYILAALLMATTSAHAGGITFQINGERIHVEAPRHCNALSCIKITAPGYSGSIGDIDLKGFGSKSKDDDVADTTPAKPTPAPAPAPVQAAAPAPAAPAATGSAPRPRCDRCAGAFAAPHSVSRARTGRRGGVPAPAPVAAAARVGADHPARHLGHRREQRQRAHRRMRPQSLRLCHEERRKDPDQHEAAGHKWTGRIHDPNSGRNYDSTIAMKGTTRCGFRAAPSAACSAAARPGSASAKALSRSSPHCGMAPEHKSLIGSD